MDEGEFVETVRQVAPLESTDAARDVAVATLETLGARIDDGVADEIAADLPEHYAQSLSGANGEAESFDVETFRQRIADRAGVPEPNVDDYARAVAAAVDRASDAFDDAREQLPAAYDPVLDPTGPTAREAFFETVADRAGLESPAAAEPVTAATLRTLGERLTGGEATDLAEHLPGPLERDLAPESREAEAATDDDYDAFVERVGARVADEADDRGTIEGEEARRYASAVGSALADVAGETELDAAREQLPGSFDALFEPPEAREQEQ